MPKSYFAKSFVSFISERLTKTSNFTYTLLEGLYLVNSSQTNARRSENSIDLFEGLFPTKTNKSKNSKNETNITIGDDVDMMYESDRCTEYDRITGNAKSLSTFLKKDDTYVDIKCKRESYTTKAKLTRNLKKWVVYTILLILAIPCIAWLFWLLLGYFEVYTGNRVVVIITESVVGGLLALLLVLKTCNYFHFSKRIINNLRWTKCFDAFGSCTSLICQTLLVLLLLFIGFVFFFS